MKSNNLPLTPRTSVATARSLRLSSRLCLGALVSAALTGLVVCTPALAQTDNFNSGALGPNWATSISANYPATITFPADSFGGQAIRMVATLPSQVDLVDEDNDSARVLAWRTDRLYTNFYVAVDILGWNTSIDRRTNGPMIALMARLTNVVRDATVPVGRPDCMALALTVNRFGGTPQGTRGVINLIHLVNGQATSLLESFGIQGDFTVDPGHKYRMVFTGTNLVDGTGAYIGGWYWGRVYDLEDLTRPLATVFCPDGFPNYGTFLGNPSWGAPGYAGVASLGNGWDDDAKTRARTTDVTFDNFVAAEYPPASVTFPGTTNGQAGLPQVVNRTPSSYSNFYAPAGGISFTATTLGGGNVTTIKLFLNDVDVSPSLTISPLSNSRTVAFPGSGLTSNMVYDARIELANAAGQKTTNKWTFDTFTDAYLASAACKNIECEDFDFGGGQFIDDPVPSGWPTNVTYYNNFQSIAYPWTGATNEDLAGPPYTSYVLKGTPSDRGVDYWDVEGKGFAVPKDYYWWEADFRSLFDPVHCPGTTEGCISYDYHDSMTPPFTGQNRRYEYDTQRQKYINVDTNLHEHMLERLEGGEWYNYTRTFNSNNYYNVYLRYASMYTTQLRLDRIVPGAATNKLGEFYTTNALARCNFRYAPLMTLATPPNSLIANGDFAANASLFTVWPGYTGGGNPTSITGWTDLFSSGGMGINGAGTSVGNPFSPMNPGSLTYAFIQGGGPGGGHVLGQYLTGLAPNTTYTLVYSVAGRTANTASYRVVLYADGTFTTSYYDSGVQPADSSRFVTVTATFTTPATLGSAPNIQLGNWSAAGDNTVDFANVFLVPGTGPVTTTKLARVNLSGTNTLRLTVDTPQEERTKYGITLNYMAFVPALLVESSPQANTGYTIDNTASVEPITRTITIPESGGARFYRLRWDHQTKMTSVARVGGNVILKYE